MKCSYCGETAPITLGSNQICYDCFCHLTSAPADRATRTEILIERLQTQHASVLKLPAESSIRSEWLERLSRRLAVLRGAEAESGPVAQTEPPKRKGPMKIHRAR